VAVSFPTGFLWGAATAAHQVEGNNDNTDWWDWEQADDPPAQLAEPSGAACEHWTRYRGDIALLADLGLNAYRFSVEWARIEPAAGVIERAALAHYSDVVDACLERGVTPIVTLQHFTLPRWVAGRGGWVAPEIDSVFASYARTVAQALGNRVSYYCTINEPGNMITRGYLGTFPTPPFVRSLDQFERAVAGVASAHRLAREAIKEVHAGARVGIAHALQDWHANAGAQPLMQWARALHEDRFFAAVDDDDFIGLQSYTRIPVRLPTLAAPLSRLLLKSRTLTEQVVLRDMRRRAAQFDGATGAEERDTVRRTDMGYEWAPEAVERTARRVAETFPGKELLITEHGVATEDDPERIEYIQGGLRAVGRLLAEGMPVTGYIHWSLLDNWEWWDGFRPRFGLIAVDRATQERTIKPSAHWYGAVAKANSLPAGPRLRRSGA
jgi:beta-glucosidase